MHQTKIHENYFGSFGFNAFIAVLQNACGTG
jgi:hypothetical protein